MLRLIVVMLFLAVLDCHGAIRGGYVQKSGNVRRNSDYNLVRTSTLENPNSFSSTQQVDADETVIQNNMPADITVKQADMEHDEQEQLFTDAELSEIISSLNEIIAALNSDIATLDSEMMRCKSEKKTSTILTVVGAAGTLGTGIGAIVQGKKLHDAKKDGAIEKQDVQKASE